MTNANQLGQTSIAEKDSKISGISRKFPTYRTFKIVSVPGWLKGKQQDDEAEGLWRIYDTLYDFSSFVDRHPGGSFWLKATKGTDITEPFESHHISTIPANMLDKYKVREALQPRNYTLTLYEDGFYKTLKRRVRKKIKDIDYRPAKRSDIIHISLLVATFGFFIASAITRFLIFEIFAGLALTWLAVAAHNYFHQKDNWQMYSFNLTLMKFSAWRISHAMSHHVYPNSLHDLEMSMFEPFLCWIPSIRYASMIQRYISLVVQPFAYSLAFNAQFIIRIIYSLTKTNIMYWHDAIGFILPTVMFLVSADDVTIFQILKQWMFIILVASFIFSVIGLNAAHHDPTIYHDGDENRNDRDWGLFQVDTIIDRADIKGSQFLVLTHFGEHSLHHLFPTLDHGILPQLNPIFFETLKEFEVELREYNQLQHIIGQNRQLLRVTANKVPPGKRSL